MSFQTFSMSPSLMCYIYRYIHGYVVIKMFEFGEYCFLKWKFKFWNFLSEIWTKGFSISQNSCSIDWNDEENDPRVSGWFDCYSILIRSIEKSIRSIERNSQPIKTRKTEFSANFSSNCSECLKRSQALWTVLWNILTLHTCLLMKYKKHKK